MTSALRELLKEDDDDEPEQALSGKQHTGRSHFESKPILDPQAYQFDSIS